MSAADDLMARVRGFGAPFGFERSAKFVEGALLADRCLMSLHRDALGDDPVAALVEAMDPPADVRAALAEALPGADFVHFGHEAEPGFAVRKLYFEYASRAWAGMAQGEAVVLHLAYKWRMDTGATALTRYVWRPCASLGEAQARIVERVAGPRGQALALRLLDRATALAQRGELAMLDVEEPGHPRISLDMNVYDADLTLGAIGGIVDEAGAAFGIAPERVAQVFAPARDKALGHLAAGLDRSGREFVTFYFGVEALGP